MQPFGTVLWSRWIFGERMSPLQWTGALMVLAGVAALSLRGSVHDTIHPQRDADVMPPAC